MKSFRKVKMCRASWDRPARREGFTLIELLVVIAIIVNSSTFHYADGHVASRKWMDPAPIAYAASMDSNKCNDRPSAAQTPTDAPWLARGYATSQNN